LKKELIGWLDVRWDDTALYPTKEEMDFGNVHKVNKLTEDLELFHEKKVRITIEEID
jgi:hypothetical protein